MSSIDLGLIVTTHDEATRGLDNVDEKVNQIGKSARQTEDRLRAIQVVIASILTGKAIQLGNDFVKTAGDIEQARIRLTLLTGDAQEAARVMQKLEDRFGGTGIKVDVLTKHIIGLRQAGIAGEQVNELADAMARFAIVTGKGDEALETMGGTLTQMLLKGKVDAGSLIEAFERSIPGALNAMAKAAGQSFHDFVISIQNGKYDAAKLIQFLIEGSKQYAGAVRLAKDSIKGSLALITEAWEANIRRLDFNADLNREIVPRFKAMREAIDDFFRGIQVETVREFFSLLNDIGDAAVNVGRGLAFIVPVTATFAKLMADIVKNLPPEAIAGGVIGYVAFGRMGALIGGAIATAYTKLTSDTKSTVDGLVTYLTDALPFGIIGLMVGGKKGLLIVTAAVAAIDFVLTHASKGLAQLQGNEGLVDFYKKGGTALQAFMIELGIAENKTATAGTNMAKNLSEPQKQASDTIRQEMEKIGLKAHQVAAVIAAAMRESTFDPNAFNPAGGGQGAHGLFQWRGPRLEELRKFAQELGTTTNDLRTQILFFIKEINSSEKAAGDALRNAASPEEASRALDKFLRYDRWWENGNKEVQKRIELTRQLTNETGNFSSQWEEMARTVKPEELGNWEKARQNANDYKERVSRIDEEFKKVAISAEKFQQALANNQLGVKTQEIAQRYQELLKAIEQARLANEKLSDQDERKATNAQRLLDLQKTLLGLRDQEVTRAETLHTIQERILQTQQLILQNKTQQQMLDLQQNFNNGVLFNLYKGTGAGQAELQVEQQKLQLKQQILQIDLQIDQLKQKAITAGAAEQAQIAQTISMMETLRQKTVEAMQNLSAAGMLANQWWQRVGMTIEQGVGNAIAGVITGTMTMKQAGLQMYQALIREASNYIVKLLMMKLLKGVLGIFGDGGIFSGNVNLFDSLSNIKPFASGGIIGGPTLFGIAGEAGTEAIMPLERVGGKLGVRATGSGGDVHIHLSAIDTQSGIEWLYGQVPMLQNMFVQRQKVNRSPEKRYAP